MTSCPLHVSGRAGRLGRVVRLTVLAVLLGALVAGCTTAEPPRVNPIPGETTRPGLPTPTTTPEPRDPRDAPGGDGAARPRSYVALGDSYASAPGVPPAQPRCGRSERNYAGLLLRRLRADGERWRLRDVTCGGATTADIVGSGDAVTSQAAHPSLRRQLEAVRPRTALVTVTIGGNDFALFSRLVRACVGTPPGTCAGAAGGVESALAEVRANVGAVLGAVRARSPRAQIAVVTYPRLVTEDGGCAGLLPLDAADAAALDTLNRGLSQALSQAAAGVGADVVDLYAASSDGHEICAADPWVTGVSSAADGTAPLHPTLAGNRAAARLLHAAVR